MKSILLSFLFLLTCTASYSQMILKSNTENIDLSKKYKQKSANTKAVGFVLLGTGLTMFIVGASTVSQNLFSEPDPTAEFAGLAGLTMAVASIPVFIIASKQKYKSAILLSQEKTAWNRSKGNTAVAFRVTF